MHITKPLLPTFAISQIFSEAVGFNGDPIINFRTTECVICGEWLTKGKGRRVFVRVNQRYAPERYWCGKCREEIAELKKEWEEKGWQTREDM